MKRFKLLLAAALLGSCMLTAQNLSDTSQSADSSYSRFGLFYQQRATLFDCLPVPDGAIVMLGNSITNGCEWHELFDNPRVINRGISGDIVEGIDTRMAALAAGKPAKIFLMIGVNDVSHDLTADSIFGDIARLAERIRRDLPQTRLYLQSCLPVNQSFGRYHRLDGKEQVVRDINRNLREYAAANGITFIDLYSLMADKDGNLRADLTNDGLHLLGPAYLIWRDALLPYINE